MTSGEDGMRTQARGLARAVAQTVVEKQVPIRSLWTWGKTPFQTPWPDLIISCGRRAVWAALKVRTASGGRTLAVHVQDPRTSHAQFDLIIAMAHDKIAPAANVIKVPTALHDVTGSRLADAAEAWRGKLAHLGHPFAGVLLGGPTARGGFALADQQRLISGLKGLRSAQATALAITPSRRTPASLIRRLSDTFADDPGVFIWDGRGANPYLGILALAERLIVTGDSVSMISEALSTGHPVEVLDLNIRAFRPFLNRLLEQGLIRHFAGEPEMWTAAEPVNATETAAKIVRAHLQAARTGVAGNAS